MSRVSIWNGFFDFEVEMVESARRGPRRVGRFQVWVRSRTVRSGCTRTRARRHAIVGWSGLAGCDGDVREGAGESEWRFVGGGEGGAPVLADVKGVVGREADRPIPILNEVVNVLELG